MPIKLTPKCPVCREDKIFFAEDMPPRTEVCDICGDNFEVDGSCQNEHFVCHMCRQKWARAAIIEHCLKSGHTDPLPLTLELLALPEVAIHGPEHHLLLAAALLTAYHAERGGDLPALLEEANARSLGVPGGACGAWGICGAAVAGGIYMSIVTGSNPYATEEWRVTGQLTSRSGELISREGGPRCCKRDTFISLMTAAAHSNEVLGTKFDIPSGIVCDFYPNNKECKRLACPFFPRKPA